MSSRSVTVDVLHDEVALALLAEVRVEEGDEGVVAHRGEHRRLGADALEVTRAVGLPADDLDRHRAAERRVFGAIHVGHAALADELLEAVATGEQVTGRDRAEAPSMLMSLPRPCTEANPWRTGRGDA